MVSRKKRWLYYWTKLGLWGQLSIFLALSVIAALGLYALRPRVETEALGANVFVFSFLNLNILLLLILTVVVGRNVVKLFFDRRRRLPGSRLRMRLVAAFVGLVLVPTLIIFVMASGLLSQAMEGWFSNQVETSVNSAVKIAREYYRREEAELLEIAEQVSQEVRQASRSDALSAALEQVRERQNLYSISIFNAEAVAILTVESAATGIVDFQVPEPAPGMIRRALVGEQSSVLEEVGSAWYAKTYLPLAAKDAVYLEQGGKKEKVLLIIRRISPEISRAISEIKDSYGEFQQLKLFKPEIWSGYLITLALITGLILFAAIWVGFFIARQITVPLQKLAEGTKAVAQGDYDIHIKAVGDDEITGLVKAFNAMTADLKEASEQAENRRIYIETILANLSVGVVGIDLDERVTLMNRSAQEVLGVDDFDPRMWLKLEQILPAEARETVYRLVSGRQKGRQRVHEVELSLWQEGRERKLQCAVGELVDARSNLLGILLIFDDITELVKAQQVSAWREAARRIAHEIKNPLTPIQLSAQRLTKLLSDSKDSQTLKEISNSIVDNVASIKRLADEFSKFARMPDIRLEPCPLNEMLSDLLSQSATLHSEVVFKFLPDPELGLVRVDQEQLRRAIYNLIDNAVASCLSIKQPDQPPAITVKTHASAEWISIEVLDTGSGVPTSFRNKIFEPYFTTKESGTGLGLAIVNSVIDGHGGRISVHSNPPHGTRFVIELPRVAV
jgi:two-component system nitrogen regulation sensor histidine kinase NtrY